MRVSSVTASLCRLPNLDHHQPGLGRQAELGSPVTVPHWPPGQPKRTSDHAYSG